MARRSIAEGRAIVPVGCGAWKHARGGGSKLVERHTLIGEVISIKPTTDVGARSRNWRNLYLSEQQLGRFEHLDAGACSASSISANGTCAGEIILADPAGRSNNN